MKSIARFLCFLSIALGGACVDANAQANTQGVIIDCPGSVMIAPTSDPAGWRNEMISKVVFFAARIQTSSGIPMMHCTYVVQGSNAIVAQVMRELPANDKCSVNPSRASQFLCETATARPLVVPKPVVH